jgi:hypothetical protein
VQGFGQGSVGDAAVGAGKKVWRNSGNGHCGGQKRGTTGGRLWEEREDT